MFLQKIVNTFHLQKVCRSLTFDQTLRDCAFKNPAGGTGGTCAGQALALQSCSSLLPEGLCLGGVFLACHMVTLKVAVQTVIIWIFLKERVWPRRQWRVRLVFHKYFLLNIPLI